MIFETLAAIAEWNNNLKFDNNATREQCETTQTDLHDAGKLPLMTETLTWDSDSKTVSEATKYSHYIYAIQKKTPRSVIESDLTDG